MHEMSIVHALIEQVGAEIEKSGHPGRVLSLDLIIGRLSGVHVDSIRFALEILGPGTVVEGADVRISEPKAEFSCVGCGSREEIDELIVCCTQCGSGDITIEGGQDLVLQSIELAED
jgi:hydrogenase nickel incorporation protein HypA/HybF